MAALSQPYTRAFMRDTLPSVAGSSGIRSYPGVAVGRGAAVGTAVGVGVPVVYATAVFGIADGAGEAA
ncbi:MAG: hypothetical protein HYY37_06995 [Candidatus Aenigmarchaeota archaeon]|nr:hypothetical protein [Candidatus Aenigmarchaeota archaeon]